MSIHVVGLGMDPDLLPEQHAAVIDGAQVLVGGRRQLAQYDDHPAEKIVVTAPLRDVLDAIAKGEGRGREVVVLADGDPLFFGIGARLVEEFGPEGVQVYSNVTSLQAAAARAKVPWQTVQAVSLHGRDDWRPLFGALRHGDWVGVLTDERNIPAAIAQRLLERGADWFAMWVFENLGAEDERFDRYALTEAGDRNFSPLNLVLLERTGRAERMLRLGVPDGEYVSDRGLITKWPVRAAGIAALGPEPDNVVWDLGAGCGSVGLETCALLHNGEVYAVERNAGRVSMIRENRRRFGALALEVVHGTMPGCLADLPDPHRVFIGGGLASDAALLDAVCSRLLSGGRLVVHCVLLATLERVRAHVGALGWSAEITMLHAAVSSPLAGDVRLEGMNPVFIITVDKP